MKVCDAFILDIHVFNFIITLFREINCNCWGDEQYGPWASFNHALPRNSFLPTSAGSDSSIDVCLVLSFFLFLQILKQRLGFPLNQYFSCCTSFFVPTYIKDVSFKFFLKGHFGDHYIYQHYIYIYHSFPRKCDDCI